MLEWAPGKGKSRKNPGGAPRFLRDIFSNPLLLELSFLFLLFIGMSMHTCAVSKAHQEPRMEQNFLKSLITYEKLKGGHKLDSLPSPIEYPPLYSLVKIPFYALFGVSRHIAVFSDLLFLFTLMLFTYLSGRQLHSGLSGLLAASLLALSPTVAALSRALQLEYAVLGIVAPSFYALLRTDYFQDRKWCFIFGLTVALGFLAKWSFFIYLIGPSIATLLMAIVKKRSLSDLNLFLVLLPLLLLAGPWYLNHPDQKFQIINSRFEIRLQGDMRWPVVLEYPMREARIYLFPWVLLLVPLAFIWLLLKRPASWLELVAGMGVPFLFFTFNAVPALRFLQPAYPYFVIAVGMLVASRGRLWARILGVSLIVLFLVQYAVLSVGYADVPGPEWPGYLVSDRNDYNEEAFVSFLNSVFERSPNPVRVLIIRQDFWDIWWMNYKSYTGELSSNFQVVYDANGETNAGHIPIPPEQRLQAFLEAQMVIGLLDTDVGPAHLPSTLDDWMSLIEQEDERFLKAFETTFDDPAKKRFEVTVLAEPELVRGLGIPLEYHCSPVCTGVK